MRRSGNQRLSRGCGSSPSLSLTLSLVVFWKEDVVVNSIYLVFTNKMESRERERREMKIIIMEPIV